MSRIAPTITRAEPADNEGAWCIEDEQRARWRMGRGVALCADDPRRPAGDPRRVALAKWREAHILVAGGMLVTWHKAPPLAQGGFARCHVGMMTPLDLPAAPPRPCVVRSRVFLPDASRRELFELEGEAPTVGNSAALQLVSEACLRREDYIAQAVSPDVYGDLLHRVQPRGLGKRGSKLLTAGPLMAGNLRTFATGMGQHDVPPAVTVQLFLADIAPKLSAMHARFVHNDIKADNILVRWRGTPGPRPFTFEIADFGFAEPLPQTPVARDLQYRSARGWDDGYLVQHNATHGAEEALCGVNDQPLSDIFSLGLLCIELVTCRPAFGFVDAAAIETLGASWLEVYSAWETVRAAARAEADLRRPVSITGATALQRRFGALWAEIYAKCPAYLANLINQMVARLYRIDPDDLDTPPPQIEGASRPSGAEIGTALDAHPLSAEMEEVARRAALDITPHGVIGERMWTALDIAAHHHRAISRALGLGDGKERA